MSFRAFARRLIVSIALWVVAVSGLGLASAPAFAQTDPYKQHMENGIKLFQEKNYPAAVAEFRAAYEAHPKANPLLNMALCYKAEFNYPRAISVLEKALKDHADTMEAGDKRASEDAIKEMRGLLAYVTVRVTPAQAILSVDGEDLAPNAANAPVPLGPGKHKIGAHLDGFAPEDADVSVVSGQRDATLSFALTPNKGWVVVVYPGMIISLDGRPIGKDQFGGMVEPGRHDLTIGRTATRAEFTVPIMVLVAQSIDVRADPRTGRPIYRGPAVGQATAPLPFTPPPEKPVTPPPPPEPPKRGLYVLGGANLMWPTATAAGKPGVTFGTNSGAAGELIGGYRVNNFAGFELLLEYLNVFTPVSNAGSVKGVTEEDGYTHSSFRFGPGVRLMTSGKSIRFVGTIGGGGVYDDLQATDINKTILRNKTVVGLDGFLLVDAGLEIDIQNVLLDACVLGEVQSTRDDNDSSNVFKDAPLGYVGFGLRVGYAFWK